MANKFEIITNALVVTDTISGIILLDFPKGDVYYISDNLDDDNVKLYDTTKGVDFRSSGIADYKLSDCVDDLEVPFTKETFRSFVNSQLGFNSASGGSEVNQDQIIYVSKAGNDSNSGLTVNKAKLTATNAEATAFALNPSSTNQIVIKSIGAGDFTEDLTIREWIHIDFTDSSLDGTFDIADNCISKFRRLQKTTAGGSVIKKTTGTGFAKVTVELLVVSAGQNGLLLNSGILHMDVGVVLVDGGIGIKAKNGSRVSFIVSEVQLVNGGIGLGTQIAGGDANFFSGNILYAKDDGTGTLIKSRVDGDIINIQGGSFIVDELYNMGANTTLNAFATEGIGTATADPTANINITFSGKIPLAQTQYTSVIKGWEFSTAISGTPGLFDLTAGNGRIVTFTDANNPVETLTFSDVLLDVSIPDILTEKFSTMYFDGNNVLQIVGGLLHDPSLRRNNTVLFVILHEDNVTINGFNDIRIPAFNGIHALVDYAQAQGGVLSGSEISTPNADLTFAQASGSITLPFISNSNINNPTIQQNSGSDPVSFTYSLQVTPGVFTSLPLGTDIDPTQYNPGDGLVAAGNFQWQPAFYFPQINRVVIAFGQHSYSTMDDAITGTTADLDDFDVNPIFGTSSKLLGFFVISKTATDLTDDNKAQFITPVGAVSVGGVSGSNETEYRIVTSNTNISVIDKYVSVNAESNPVVVTLPSLPVDGQRHQFFLHNKDNPVDIVSLDKQIGEELRPLEVNEVGRWGMTLNTGGTSTPDDSGVGNVDLTIFGDATFENDTVNGRNYDVLDLNTTGRATAVGYKGILGGSLRTHAFYAKNDFIGAPSGTQTFFSYGQEGSNGKMVRFEMTAPELRLATTGRFRTWDNAIINDGEWHHLCVVFETGQTQDVQLYVDGILQTPILTQNGIIETVSASDFTIGASQTFVNKYAGFISDFRFYNVALTSEQASILSAQSAQFTFALSGFAERSKVEFIFQSADDHWDLDTASWEAIGGNNQLATDALALAAPEFSTIDSDAILTIEDDKIYVDTTLAPISITLPVLPLNGQPVELIAVNDITTNNITFNTSDGKLIDGSSTRVFNRNNTVAFFIFNENDNEWQVKHVHGTNTNPFKAPSVDASLVQTEGLGALARGELTGVLLVSNNSQGWNFVSNEHVAPPSVVGFRAYSADFSDGDPTNQGWTIAAGTPTVVNNFLGFPALLHINSNGESIANAGDTAFWQDAFDFGFRWDNTFLMDSAAPIGALMQVACELESVNPWGVAGRWEFTIVRSSTGNKFNIEGFLPSGNINNRGDCDTINTISLRVDAQQNFGDLYLNDVLIETGLAIDLGNDRNQLFLWSTGLPNHYIQTSNFYAFDSNTIEITQEMIDRNERILIPNIQNTITLNMPSGAISISSRFTVVNGTSNVALLSSVLPNRMSIGGKSSYDIQPYTTTTFEQTAIPFGNVWVSELETSVFSNADKNKLDGIEALAQVNQNDAEIKSAYESNANTNAFTDTEKTKLSNADDDVSLRIFVNAGGTITRQVGTFGSAATMVNTGTGKYTLSIPGIIPNSAMILSAIHLFGSDADILAATIGVQVTAGDAFITTGNVSGTLISMPFSLSIYL